MRLLSVLIISVFLVSCSHVGFFGNPISYVEDNPLQSMVYEAHELPAPYQAMIADENNVPKIRRAYEDATDDYVRYSFAVVMFEKSAGELSDESRKEVHEFFQQALNDKFDWVRVKAIWGLEKVGTTADYPALIKMMEEENTYWEDDVHSALTMIQARTQDRQPAAETTYNFRDSKYWRKFAK